jgi:hypothetical protein
MNTVAAPHQFGKDQGLREADGRNSDDFAAPRPRAFGFARDPAARLLAQVFAIGADGKLQLQLPLAASLHDAAPRQRGSALELPSAPW